MRWRIDVVAVAVLVALVAVTACSTDPAPTATPVPTATPTAMPVPTVTLAPIATAMPTPITTAVQPSPSLRNFVLDMSTTGQDLIDHISEREAACFKEVSGDAAYQAVLGMPLLAVSGDPGEAAPLFGCLSTENAVLLGVALLDAAAGGRSEQTRMCIADFALERPELIYERLGLEWRGEGTSHGTGPRTVILGFYTCMTGRERADALINLYTALDAASPLSGKDLVALLPEAEATCVRDALTEGEYAALVSATPLRAAGVGVSATDCLTLDSVAAFFVIATEGVLGDISGASVECIGDFVLNRHGQLPIFAAYLNDRSLPFSSADLMEVAEGGFELFDCLNEDELVRIDELATAIPGA